MSKSVSATLILAMFLLHPVATAGAGVWDFLRRKKPANRAISAVPVAAENATSYTPMRVDVVADPAPSSPSNSIRPATLRLPAADDGTRIFINLGSDEDPLDLPETGTSKKPGSDPVKPTKEAASQGSRAATPGSSVRDKEPIAVTSSETVAPAPPSDVTPSDQPTPTALPCHQFGPVMACPSCPTCPQPATWKARFCAKCQSMRGRPTYPECPPYADINYGYSPTQWRRLPVVVPGYRGVTDGYSPANEFGRGTTSVTSPFDAEGETLTLPPPIVR